MMRLTRSGEYAIRCVLYLSSLEKTKVVTRRQIAREMDIPDQFLGKIGQQLSRSGIIDIIQGPKGGFRLSVPSDQLSLLNVIESIEGPIFLNDCVLRPDSCGRSCTCSVHSIWLTAKDQLRKTLGEATFADMVHQNKENQ